MNSSPPLRISTKRAPLERGPVSVLPSLSPEEFQRFSRYISARLGIVLAPSKRIMLGGRLGRRIRSLGLQSYSQYFEHLISSHPSGDEQHAFAHLVTTHKTEFFRESDHFDVLAARTLPELVAQRCEPLSIWSAGCSTGEEVYSIAMTVDSRLEILGQRSRGFVAWGTDVSTRVLDVAATAIYPMQSASTVPESFRVRYLMRSRDDQARRIRIIPELRAKTRFQQLNFADSTWSALPMMDIIFCRNVLIYFKPEAQKAIVRRLAEHLSDGGYVFLGHAEGMLTSIDSLTFLGNSVYVKQRTRTSNTTCQHNHAQRKPAP